MDPIYTVIIAILAVLAVSGLFVGVTNDAVNFLNSAIGSKAAPRRVILIVASIGILVGTLTSSGMMEVARNGMFDPGMFSFHEVILLYLSVMFANIILLDLYNSWGLPTSTTVSLIFCLLGAAIAVSTFKIARTDEEGEVGRNVLVERIHRHRGVAGVAGDPEGVPAGDRYADEVHQIVSGEGEREGEGAAQDRDAQDVDLETLDEEEDEAAYQPADQ